MRGAQVSEQEMTPLERRVKARAAAMGYSLEDLVRAGKFSRQSLHFWLRAKLSKKGAEQLKPLLGVDDAWFACKDIETALAGLSALLAK